MLRSGITREKYLEFYGGLHGRRREWGKKFGVKDQLIHPRLQEWQENGCIIWANELPGYNYGLMPMLNDYSNYNIKIIDYV